MARKRGINGNNNWLIIALLAFLIVLVFAILYLNKDITGDAIRAFSAPKSSGSVKTLSQCADHIDNDGDGFCDANVRRAYCSDGSKLGDPDCSSKDDNSESYIIPVNTCNNLVKDSTETDVDCGGSCQDCQIGKSCIYNSDCASNNCLSGVCKEEGVLLGDSCTSIKFSGQTSNKINIIFVPSGFNGNMTLFEQKARWIASIFNKYEPLNQSNPDLNILISKTEGGNYCYFNCNGIDRLLCCDVSKARSLATSCFSSSTSQVVVVHNSGTYGGAGYRSSNVATTSINSNAPLVAVHELGHSAFNLGDEYTYQDSSYPVNSQNCDLSTCSKWKSMLGYKGVSCTSNRCANGQYYSSETTIMHSLNYKFEEVNLRQSCCTYYQQTSRFPNYCTQFNQFGDLASYCSTSNFGSTSSVPLENVSDAYQYEFYVSSDQWVLSSVEKVSSKLHPKEKVKGQEKGNIKIELSQKGIKNSLLFEDQEDVEFFDTESPKGYEKVPRKTLTIVIDHSKGIPEEILINNKKVK